MDPATFDLAVKRLSAGWTPALIGRSVPDAVQADLL